MEDKNKGALKRIVFDARMYGLENAGIGRYVSCLLAALRGLSPALLKNLSFMLLTLKSNQKSLASDLGNWYHYCPVSSRHYSFSEQVELPLTISNLKPDLVHFPHFNVPMLYSGSPLVVTIHDLIKHFFRGEETTTRNPILYWPKYVGYRLLVNNVIKKARRIIVPTHWWKDKLIEMYGIPKNKVCVTHEGIGEIFLEREATTVFKENMVLDKYRLSGRKYFIYTGSVYPHKNVERLVKAFRNLDESNLDLVIVCSRSEFLKKLESFAKKGQGVRRIKFLGFVPDEELKIIYRNAIALVQPSLMEGFGLTGLEAMACDCPVISSAASCLSEVYGKAALYFDPYSEVDIKEKLEATYKDKSLRLRMIALGREQIKNYSWLKMAQETVQIYREILGI